MKVSVFLHGWRFYFIYILGICVNDIKFLLFSDATIEEALDIIKKCIAQNNKRFIVALPCFSVTIISENGVEKREIEVNAL